MAKSRLIARQSAHPRGLLGQIVARVMAIDTASVNRIMLEMLEPKPGDRILEVGCGHGRALRRTADRILHGRVMGIDPSLVMCEVATRHNRQAISTGRVCIEQSSVESIPASDSSFDKAFSVHTIYFWSDLELGLREIRRVLRPGGPLHLAFHSSENRAVADQLPDNVYTLRTDAEVVDALKRSGFHNVEITIDGTSQIRLATANR